MLFTINNKSLATRLSAGKHLSLGLMGFLLWISIINKVWAGQSKLSDSIMSVLAHKKGDSLKTDAILNMMIYLDSNNFHQQIQDLQFQYLNHFTTAILSHNQAITTSSQLDHLGVNSRNNGQYLLAINYHETALNLAQKVNYYQTTGKILNNIGVVYRRLDNYQKALDYHMQALKFAENNGDSITLAIAINSLGNIHALIGNLDIAAEMFNKSYRLEEERGNQLGIAINLNNIANVYKDKGDWQKAIEYYNLSLDINKKINNSKGVAICYNDLGNLYQLMGDYKKSHEYMELALNINLQLNDKNYLAYSYIKLGELYTETNQNQLALEHLIPGLILSKEINAKYNITEAYNSLFQVSCNMGKYKKAVEYLELAHQYHDSILNINIRKEIARLQISFDSERQVSQINSLEQQAAISKLQMKRQKAINFLISGISIFALILITFLLFYLYTKNKTNRLLLEKNRLIEKAGKDLDSYAKQLLLAKKEAEKNNRVKSEFLANMSHEIRTPLNSVIGFAELLAHSTSNQQHLSYLQIIRNSGKNLLTLINDILDLSKIESEQLNIQYSPVDLRLILREIEQVFIQQITEKKLLLNTGISDKFPSEILFSDIRFRQILFNLVGNAIKFTEQGKITILLDCDCYDNDRKLDVAVYVVDSGLGINEPTKKLIFDPFKQAENSSSRQGTGLGLSITKRLVEMMHGNIWVESRLEKGSVFSVYFPDIKIINKTTQHSSPSITTNLQASILFFVPESPDWEKYSQVIPPDACTSVFICHKINEAEKYLAECNLLIVGTEDLMANEEITKLIQAAQQLTNTAVISIDPRIQELTQEPQIHKLPINININTYTQTVYKALNHIKPGFTDNWFFKQSEIYSLDKDFIKTNSDLFNQYFLTAVNTKLINHIQLFCDELRYLGETYNDQGIIAYCLELENHTHDFNTFRIDTLLKLYEHQFAGLVHKNKT